VEAQTKGCSTQSESRTRYKKVLAGLEDLHQQLALEEKERNEAKVDVCGQN
jgi:hypothetical protein